MTARIILFFALIGATANQPMQAARQESYSRTQEHEDQEPEEQPEDMGFFARHKTIIKVLAASLALTTTSALLGFYMVGGPRRIVAHRKWMREEERKQLEQAALDKIPKPLPPLKAPKSASVFVPDSAIVNQLEEKEEVSLEDIIATEKKFAKTVPCGTRGAQLMLYMKNGKKMSEFKDWNGCGSSGGTSVALPGFINTQDQAYPGTKHCYQTWFDLVDNASTQAVNDKLFRVSKVDGKAVIQGMSFQFDPATKEARIGLEEKKYEVAKIIPEDLANKIAQAEKSWDNASALSKELFAKVFPQEQVKQ